MVKDSKSHNLYIGQCRLLTMTRPRFTIDEKYFICRAINMYGSEMHPWVTPENLDSFYDTYISKVISDVPDEDLTDEGLEHKENIQKKLEMKE